MSGIKVARDENRLVIDWQQSMLEIPLSEAVHVALDQSAAGCHPALLKKHYGTGQHCVIQTGPTTYLLFSGNRISALNKTDTDQ